MATTVQLPEALADRLERLAKDEGTTIDELIWRLVADHVGLRSLKYGPWDNDRRDVRFPLIPATETGVILPVTGADLDEILSCDDLAS